MQRMRRPTTITAIAERTRQTRKAVYAIFDTEPSIVQVTPRRWRFDSFDGTLQQFAAAAGPCRDDVGLIDEPSCAGSLRPAAGRDLFDKLVEACGFVRLNGLLSAKANNLAAVKAALLCLDRPAKLDEVAHLGNLDRRQVVTTSKSAESLVVVSPGMWVAAEARGGVYARFAAAVQANQDDVGLIDEQRLAAIAARDAGNFLWRPSSTTAG